MFSYSSQFFKLIKQPQIWGESDNPNFLSILLELKHWTILSMDFSVEISLLLDVHRSLKPTVNVKISMSMCHIC